MNLLQKIFFATLLLIFVIKTDNGLQAEKAKSNVVEDVIDHKDFKKLLRSKTNILVCFVSITGTKTSSVLKSFKEAADTIKGHGTMVVIQCSGNAKKLCRMLKINESVPFQIKHYKNGEFHKDYDRKLAASSFVNFMRDPSGGIPWEEDPTSVDVVHLTGTESFSRFLKKGSVLNRPLLVVFYAPWCSYCATLKPEIAAVASDLKGKAFIAAFDTSRSENLGIAHQFNITILPTLLYFENGKFKFPYEGDNTRSAIFDFMIDPQPVQKTLLKSNIAKEKDWALTDSDVVHLTSDSFESLLTMEKSALVVFHAPWCGHCKKIKPEYERAASLMKDRGIPGMLGAVDATKEPELASKFGVKGYPTLKYFANGEYKFDISVREESKIVEFMKDPKEPAPPPVQEPMWPDPNPVVLLQSEDFRSTLKKKKHALVMFYAPWCGHCKKLKPDFVKLAETYSDESRVLIAAVDCTEQNSLCNDYSVKGYPTIKYFSYFDKVKQDYTGPRMLDDMVNFLKDPSAPIIKQRPQSTLTRYEADIMSLTDSTFNNAIASPKPTLVMFYAPWCGHCTATKPAFEEASKLLEAEKIPATLRILDSTEHTTSSSLYKIVSFPTFKVFQNGNYVIDYKGERTKQDFVNFIKNYLKLHKTEL